MLSRIGRYEVLAELGRGGFGHVYRCLDPVLGTPVAIKILMSDGDARMLVRFRNEAATSRKLTHPNIVTIYDFGDHEGQPYIVMELLEGQDLQHVIESRLPLTLLEKVQIMNQIAAGLGHAHENGILHRDVKPANVMLLKDHSVKIMDFGIALITRTNSTRMTPQGSMIGTLRYLAPEQFREDKPDPRSDIFAYGLVSYELLGGTHPFNATDPAALMYSILRDEPVPISQVAPECPEQLQSIIERLLQKDPDLRYQTLEDVQLDLGTVLSELREQRAVTLLEEAKAASSTGELERARELTREVLALVPGHRTARLFREQLQAELRRRANRPRLDELVQQGRRAMTAGNPVEAAKKFEAALGLDPNDAGLQDLLRAARSERDLLRDANQALARAEKAFQTGDYAGARMLAGQALQIAPHLERAKDLQHSAEAELMHEHRQVRFDEQIGKARQLLESHAWDAVGALLVDLERDYPGESILADLGHALVEARQKEQREQQLAADLNSVRKQVLTGDLTGAVARLEQLTNLYSESNDARAMLRVVRNKIESERQRDFVKAKVTEAEALESKQQFDAAVQVLDTALARYPADTGLMQRRQVAVALQTARRTAIDKALARAAELRAQARFPQAIEALDAFTQTQGREAAIVEARESIVQEQQAARLAAELADFLRRADHLVSEEKLEAAAKLLSDPPAQLKTHADIAKARESVEARLRAREKEAKQLCTRASALLKSGPAEALALLRAAPPVLRARGDVADLIESAERAVEQQRARQLEAERAAIALKQAQEKEADRQSRLSAIRAHAAAQRFTEAEQAARDGLGVHRDDPSIAKLLAEVHEQHHRWDLEQEEKKREDARLALTFQVNELIAAHRFAEAERAVEADLAAHRDDFEITSLLVDVRDRRRRYEAEQAAARAVQEESKRKDARRALIAHINELIARQRFEDAERGIQGALAAQPGDPEMTALLEHAREQRRRTDEQKRKDARRALATQVRDLTAKQRYDDAERSIEQLLKGQPGDAEVTKLLKDVREQHRQWDAQQAAILEAEARSAAARRVETLLAERRYEDAERAVRVVLAVQPGHEELTKLLANVRDHSRRALNAQANDLATTHRFDEAERAIQKDLASHRDDLEITSLLAKVQQQHREWDAEQEALRKAQEKQRRTEARTSLAAQVADLVANNRYDEAERALQQDLAANRDDVEITNLLTKTQQQRRKWDAERRNQARASLIAQVGELVKNRSYDEAERALQQDLTGNRDDIEITSLLAKVRDQHRQWDAERRKQARAALTSQVEELLKNRRYDEAERALQQDLAANRDDVEITSLLAKVRDQHRQWDAEQAAIRKAQEEQRRKQARAALTSQVEELLTNRRYDEAERAVQQDLAANRDDVEITSFLAKVRDQHRQWNDEQAALRKAQARRELIARIRDIASRHQYNEAERAVTEALASDPDDRDLTALNFEVRGQHRQWEAEQAATRAAQEVERRKEARRVLVARIRELVANDRYDEADRAIAQAFADDPESPELAEVRDNLSELRREWSAKQAENEVRQTLARMRQLIAQQPAQAVAQLEALARQYAGRSEIQSMLAEARDAAARAEEESNRRLAADALRAVAPFRAKNPKRALKQLEQLPHAVQARPEIATVLDECRRLAAIAPPLWSKPAFIGSAAGAIIAAAAGIWFATNKPTPPVEAVPVEIATDPAGVTVTAGGFTCVTPACSLRLAPGSYQVIAKRDGYEPAQQPLTIVAGTQPGLISLTLKPIIVEHPPTPGVASGTLTVRAGIPDALVYIDNAPAGRTTAAGDFTTKLEAASHNVRVEKVGFETPTAKTVIVAKNETSRLTFTLTPENATLELRGAPAGVEIRAGGALIGKTDGGVFSKTIPPGSKTLRFTLGSDSNEVARTFDPGRTVSIDWPSVAPAVPKPVTPKEVTKEPPKPVTDPAEVAWEGIRNANDPAVFESYVQRFPSSPHKDEAQARIESIIWSRTGPTDASALKTYMSRFPNGPHAKEAASHLDDITWNAVDKNSASALRDFATQNPNSAHINDARSTITQLEKKAQDEAEKAKAGNQAKLDAGQQQQAIRATLNEFNAAFQHRNGRELRQIWTNPMKDLVDAAGQGSEVTLEPTGPADIKGDTASLVCTYSITVRGKASTARVRVILQKNGDRWLMTGPFQKP